jgi:hypothetical protein
MLVGKYRQNICRVFSCNNGTIQFYNRNFLRSFSSTIHLAQLLNLTPRLLARLCTSSNRTCLPQQAGTYILCMWCSMYVLAQYWNYLQYARKFAKLNLLVICVYAWLRSSELICKYINLDISKCICINVLQNKINSTLGITNCDTFGSQEYIVGVSLMLV